MTEAIPSWWRRNGAEDLAEEACSVLVGAGFTLGLFLGMAHLENTTREAPPVAIEDLRAMPVPLEPPPPSPVVQPETAPAAASVAGLEVAPADSPVRIAVTPPDLNLLAVPAAPAAKIQTAQLYTEFRPKIEVSSDFQRVFQQSEVDRIPVVMSRADPFVPGVVRNGATTLRTIVLMIVDIKGVVASIRIVDSSGNAEFDKIITQSIKETWVFSPAMKNGKRVKCMLQQSVRVKWEASSPFEYK